MDDELLIRQGIKHYFNWEEKGFQIVGEAANGKEALELVETVKPHIIITDIVMPIMDGEELTKQVKQKYLHIQIIVLSSFGEFDYVRSTFQHGAVDYILKPKLEADGLLEALRSATTRIPNFQLLQKKLEPEDLINQELDKLLSGYETDQYPQEVATFFPHDTYYLLGVKTNQHPSIDEQLQTIFTKKLSPCKLHFVKEQENNYIYLINFHKQYSQTIVTVLREFSKTQPGECFTLSEAFHQFKEIGNIYKNCLLPLLRSQFYLLEQNLLESNLLEQYPTKQLEFNLEGFTEELKREHFDEAFNYVRDHGKKLSTCITMDINEFKGFFNNIMFNITVFLRNMGYDVTDLEKEKYRSISAVDGAHSAREVVTVLENYLADAKVCISSHQENAVDNVNMKRLLDYVSEHYMEPLTLTEVARHFHFNPSYLSSYFASHNKESFIEYLNKVRIEAAIQHLRQGAVSISEISSMVGYSDHSYFCKVFKKITGYSPSQYRRKQLS